MIQSPTTAEKIRKIPWLLATIGFNSIFCQLTVFGTVFILFLNKMELPKSQIGFIISLFPFCGISALFTSQKIAKFGVKRVYQLFWTLRNVFTALLLFTPIILVHYGKNASFIFISLTMIAFGFCRSFGETGYNPWMKEVIPDNIRGKVVASTLLISNIIAIISISFVSYVLSVSDELNIYIILIAIGVAAGLISIWCSSKIPGGAPKDDESTTRVTFKSFIEILKDKQFSTYLKCASIILFASGPGIFIPLYMKEIVGIKSSQVMIIMMSASVGALITGYLWGWATDRFGSKPVYQICVLILGIFPLFWIFIPKHSSISFPFAIIMMFVAGMFSVGWATADSRMLYTHVVPKENTNRYMAVYYACVSVIIGLSPLVAGNILEFTKGVSGKLWFIPLNAYTPIFLFQPVLMVIAVMIIGYLKTRSDLPAMKFAGMFVRGNPLTAMLSLLKHKRAKDEGERVQVAKMLGDAKSPIVVEELLIALKDPSFNVRYESIISIARMEPDKRLIDALIGVIQKGDPELSVVACWALGTIGDERAVPVLRGLLCGKIKLLNAMAARSLASLGDCESIPDIIGMLKSEPDEFMNVAAASALGILGVRDSIKDILDCLRGLSKQNQRQEVSLVIARLIGGEQSYINYIRDMEVDAPTVVSNIVYNLNLTFKKRESNHLKVSGMLDSVAEELAYDFDKGSRTFGKALGEVSLENNDEVVNEVLKECKVMLENNGSLRIEYLQLALHSLSFVLNNLEN